jgi:hypothetical protein
VNTEFEVLQDAVGRLERAGIAYMLAGSIAFGRRVRIQLPGFDAWIVSKEDLILSKLVWAKPSMSELQLRDVRALLASSPDTAYLRRWAADLSVADLLEKNFDAGHDT